MSTEFMDAKLAKRAEQADAIAEANKSSVVVPPFGLDEYARK